MQSVRKFILSNSTVNFIQNTIEFQFKYNYSNLNVTTII